MKRILFIVGALASVLVLFSCQTSHAIPTKASYSVRYNPNGGTGGVVPEDSTSYLKGTEVKVLGNISGTLVNTGYAFDGWNTSADGKGSTYDSRGVFGPASFLMGDSNVLLYAMWMDPLIGPWNLTSVNGQSVLLAPLGFQSLLLRTSAENKTWSMTSTPASGAAEISTGTWAVGETAANYTFTSGNIVTFKGVINGTTLTLTPTTMGATQVMVFSKQ